MAHVNRVQAGYKAETTWGTAVTVDRFREFVSDDVTPKFSRVESNALRSGNRVQRNDRFAPYQEHAEGNLVLEAMSLNDGVWFEHMLGTITSSSVVDSAYTHTATMASLLGKGITFQSNRPLHPGDTDRAFTFEGGKVANWKISCKAGEPAMIDLGLEFEKGEIGTALASASYPSSNQLLTFLGGAVTVAGVAVSVTEVEIEVDNKLDVERRFLGSGLHAEPVEAGWREIKFKLTCDWSGTVQYDRVASATASGALAAIEATFTGPTLIGTATYPSLKVRVDEARFDEIGLGVDGPEPLQSELSGVGFFDGTNSPVTITYVTTESTP